MFDFAQTRTAPSALVLIVLDVRNAPTLHPQRPGETPTWTTPVGVVRLAQPAPNDCNRARSGTGVPSQVDCTGIGMLVSLGREILITVLEAKAQLLSE